MVVKDLRIFRNTVERALETLRASGVDAFAEQNDHEEYLEYIVRVSKETAYHRKKSS
jgi:ParB family chromosome partitioning protein